MRLNPPVSPGLHASGAWALIGGSIRCPETQLWLSTSNFACNSPVSLSNPEIRSLELQRFQMLLKLRPIELHAIFRFLLACRSPARWLGPAGVLAISHVIRLRLFQIMNSCRGNFNVSGLLLRVGAIELGATFPGVVAAVTRCFLWRPSCRCGLVCCCVLAPHPACVRYKVRPAWLVGGENGRKFAMHAQNTPKRAISSEQGEFYTAHAVRRGVQGEFCTGSGAV